MSAPTIPTSPLLPSLTERKRPRHPPSKEVPATPIPEVVGRMADHTAAVFDRFARDKNKEIGTTHVKNINLDTTGFDLKRVGILERKKYSLKELTQKSKLARLDPVQNPLLSLRPHFPSYLEATSRATDGDAAENRAGNLIESRHLQRAHPHRAPSTLKMEGPSHLDLADNFEEVLVDFLVEKHQRPKNHLELDDCKLSFMNHQLLLSTQHSDLLSTPSHTTSEPLNAITQESFFLHFQSLIAASDNSDMHPELLESILNRLPISIRESNRDLLTQLVNEVKEAFAEGSRVSSISHILRRPSAKASLTSPSSFNRTPPFLQDLSPLLHPPTGWRERFLLNRIKLRDSLHLVHPLNRQILRLWYDEAEQVRFVDLVGLMGGESVSNVSMILQAASHTRQPSNFTTSAPVVTRSALFNRPLRISNFKSSMMMTADSCRTILMTKWHAKIVDAVKEHFHRFVQTLDLNQLQDNLKHLEAHSLHASSSNLSGVDRKDAPPAWNRQLSKPRSLADVKSQLGRMFRVLDASVVVISTQLIQSLTRDVEAYSSLFLIDPSSATPVNPFSRECDVDEEWVRFDAWLLSGEDAKDSTESNQMSSASSPALKDSTDSHLNAKPIKCPHFVVSVSYDAGGSGEIIFEPPLSELQECLVDGVTSIAESLESFPRLEHELLGDGVGGVLSKSLQKLGVTVEQLEAIGLHLGHESVQSVTLKNLPDCDVLRRKSNGANNSPPTSADATNNRLPQPSTSKNLRFKAPKSVETLFTSDVTDTATRSMRAESSRISVSIHPDVLSSARDRVTKFCEKSIQQVAAYMDHYRTIDRFISLALHDQSSSTDRSFEKIKARADWLKTLAEMIRNCPRVVELPLVQLHFTPLHEALVTKTETLSIHHIQHIVDQLQAQQRSICEQFELISDKALHAPTDFAEMAECIQVMARVKTIELPNLHRELDDARLKLLVILDFNGLTEQHMKLNNVTFQWPSRIIPVMAKFEQLLAIARDRNEKSLRDRKLKFIVELQEMQKQVLELNEVGDVEEMPFVVRKAASIAKQLQQAQEVIQVFHNEEELFELELSEYLLRKQIIKQLEPFQTLYACTAQYQKVSKKWLDGNWSELSASQIEAELSQLHHDLTNLLEHHFLGESVDGNAPTPSKPAAIGRYVIEKLQEFQGNLPLIKIVCNQGLRDRHWLQMSQLCGAELQPTSGAKEMTLRRVLKMNLERWLPDFQLIHDTANREFSLEKSLAQMKEKWKPVVFECVLHRQSNGTLLAAVDDLQQMLDDQLVKSQGMRVSPFVKPFEAEIASWEHSLTRAQEIIDVWLQLQSSWLYLEPLFSSSDLSSQLPAEAHRFKQVDFVWHKFMESVKQDPRVMSVTANVDLLDTLRRHHATLESIIKGLVSYLEKKRIAFPRFFFLSNDEMLEILAETRDPRRVQPHLKKCFEGVASLEFSGEAMEVVAAFSSEGEKLLLRKPIPTVGPSGGGVEKWLLSLQHGTSATIQHQIHEAFLNYSSTAREVWLKSWPGQVVLCVGQLVWTAMVEKALVAGGGTALVKVVELLSRQLNELVVMVRGELPRLVRCTLEALVVMEVHARDVVAQLIQESICDIADFSWISQLRYYSDVNLDITAPSAAFDLSLTTSVPSPSSVDPTAPPPSRVLVKMISSVLHYGYEYLGNSSRLVITPLTDRCYRTLFGALQLGLGGAPEGPAGTGKTETVKDLAKALGMLCVVFNCSEGLDYLTMGKFLKGLASSGEDVTVLQSIRTINIPKFLKQDLELFTSIMVDLFPSLQAPPPERVQLLQGLKDLAPGLGLQATDLFLDKCVQLMEMMRVRHGCMLVGDVFSSKTSAYRLLAATYNSLNAVNPLLFPRVSYAVINPKALTLAQLYGQFDSATHEWIDGVLAILYRPFSVSSNNDRKWIVFDGPVDATWVENLNTVLDDNKKLCLMSGESVKLSDTMTILFEVADLKVASPATVSRCGMIYMESSSIGWRAHFDEWKVRLRLYLVDPVGPLIGVVQERGLECVDKLMAEVTRLFDTYVDALLSLVSTMKQACCTSSIGLTRSSMSLLFSLIRRSSPTIFSITTGSMDITMKFLFAIIWSIGGVLTDESERVKFDVGLRDLVRVNDGVCCFPPDLSVYDYVGDFTLDEAGQSSESFVDGVGGWRLWTVAFPEAQFDPISVAASADSDLFLNEIMVPTKDTVRLGFLLSLNLATLTPTLFVGPTSTGKSKVMLQHLQALSHTHLPFSTNFTTRTTALQAQATLMSKLEKRKKGTYGPPLGHTLNVFIDDLNRTTVEKYGAQPPVELLRQLLDHGSWFDETHGYSKMEIVNVLLLGATGSIGGGQSNPTPRFLRHFHCVSVNLFDNETLNTIYLTLLSVHLSNFTVEVQSLTKQVFETIAQTQHFIQLVTASISLFKSITSRFLPTPATPHYAFNLRNLSRVFHGLSLSSTSLFQKPLKFIRLWVHELIREFQDRLVSEADRDWFFKAVKATIREHLCKDMGKLFKHLIVNAPTSDKSIVPPQRDLQSTDLQLLLFGTHLTEGGDTLMPADSAPSTTIPVPGIAEKKVAHKKIAYMELTNVAEVAEVILRELGAYNRVHKKQLTLIPFSYAIQHCCRVNRILQMHGGNALLLGVGGSGRQTVTRLAAHLSSMELVQIEMMKSYGITEWRDDLRKVLKRCGCWDVSVVFLFSDAQLKSGGGGGEENEGEGEWVLEDLNNLLTHAAIPSALFTVEDRLSLLDESTGSTNATLNGRTDSAGDDSASKSIAEKRVLDYSEFVRRIKRNLHVVLCLSPVGDVFRQRLRQFPSLLNCYSVNWFDSWPDDALRAVSEYALHDLNLLPHLRAPITSACIQFHMDAIFESQELLRVHHRHCYVTPTSYMEFLSRYHFLLNRRRSELDKSRMKYEMGLQKLEFAATQIGKMQVELGELQPQLLRTTRETGDMLARIQSESKAVEATRKVIEAEELVASAKAQQAQAIKKDCESDLAQALPLLNNALAALDTLKKSDIDLVKAMKNPPDGVKMVMEAVCVMKDIKADRIPDPAGTGKMIPDWWKSSLKMLSDPRFLDSLRQYDKDSISPQIVKQIRLKFLVNPEFKPEKVRNASSAAEGLCQWVLAMEAYDRIIKIVAPKQSALQQAEQELQVTMSGLEEKRGKLKAVVDRLDALNATLDRLYHEKETLLQRVDGCEKQLERAQRLLTGLGGEKIRWTRVVQELDQEIVNSTGDVLLSAGMVAYFSPLSQQLRNDCMQRWIKCLNSHDIPCTVPFNLSSVLGTPSEIQQWQLSGLPADDFSTNNALILHNSRRWPLLIDPQGQANYWIRSMAASKGQGLQIVKLTDADFLRRLENAVAYGATMLVEGVGETLDPILDPLLMQETFQNEDGIKCLRIGDHVGEYSDAFRLILTTRHPNPHFLPDLASKLTLINFSITPEGLEDQLLSVLVSKERPELEGDKQRLIQQSADIKKQLLSLEDEILQTLASAEGNILENDAAIEVLSSSKRIAVAVEEKQRVAEITRKEIDVTRNSYRPLAAHSSRLFFSVSDLRQLDAMYQFSLNAHLRLFLLAIETSVKSSNLVRRLKSLELHFTYSLFCSVCRSLFERHKSTLALHIAIHQCHARSECSSEEIHFLIHGGIGLQSSLPENVHESWLPDVAWQQLCHLSKLRGFEELVEDLSLSVGDWKLYFNATDASGATLPARWYTSLSEMQRLLVARCGWPEKMVTLVQSFVKTFLGPKFLEPPGFDLSISFQDSAARTCLILILSQGMDPMPGLGRFAESMEVIGNLYRTVSLGQGQGPLAAAMIRQGWKEGGWVVLQNCHLAESWMPQLEAITEEMASGSVVVHKDFRLWLTSYPTPHFPVSILESGVKMTNEAPRGVRANLLRVYSSDPVSTDSFYQPVNHQQPWERLLFSLCFFHAIVQERRSFGPVGWNIPYEFSESDLHISLRQLRKLMDSPPTAPTTNSAAPFSLKSLLYLVGECNYGGRVTDEWDRRTLMSLLSNFVTVDAVPVGNFKLSVSGIYVIPPVSSHAQFVEYIKSLPSTQMPELFGIHENGDLARCQLDSSQLLESLLLARSQSVLTDLMPRAGEFENEGSGLIEASSTTFLNASSALPATSTGKTTTSALDSVLTVNVDATSHKSDTTPSKKLQSSSIYVSPDAALLQTIQLLLDALPPPFDVVEAARRYPINYAQSMNTVLLQELLRYNRLCATIRPSLQDVVKALRGEIIMNELLEKLCQQLLIGHVPSYWLQQCYPTQKLLASFIQDLTQRLSFLERWLVDGVPSVFWISAFFFPQSFITGCLQNHARRHRLPIDQLTLGFEVLSMPAPGVGVDLRDVAGVGDGDGVYIFGPHLIGARWNVSTRSVAESFPRILSEPLPMIWLKPCVKVQHAPLSVTGSTGTTPQYSYACPLYQTSLRRGLLTTTGHSTNFVLTLQLPSDKEPKHWIHRGVAAVLQLDV